MNGDTDDMYYDNTWQVCLYDTIYCVRHETAWDQDGYTIVKENLTWKEAERFKKSIIKLKGG